MPKINLMTHIVAGYPNIEESKKIALSLVEGGSSFLEIQIPFTDPIADGKVIQKANIEALKNNITPDDCFKLMSDIKKETSIPVLFMTYFNIPFRYGLEKFCKKAKRFGCYGLIIPDIPIDEEDSEHYIEICQENGLHAIQVISPITPARRLKKIAFVASGFVYCVSHTGLTGEDQTFSEGITDYLNKVRKYIKVPLALGFGISTKDHVLIAASKADIVVIGSKILNVYNESEKKEKTEDIKNFIESVL